MFKVSATGQDGKPYVVARTHRRVRDGEGLVTFHDEIEEKTELEFEDMSVAVSSAELLARKSEIKSVVVTGENGQAWPEPEPKRRAASRD